MQILTAILSLANLNFELPAWPHINYLSKCRYLRQSFISPKSKTDQFCFGKFTYDRSNNVRRLCGGWNLNSQQLCLVQWKDV